MCNLAKAIYYDMSKSSDRPDRAHQLVLLSIWHINGTRVLWYHRVLQYGNILVPILVLFWYYYAIWQ
jgi:hypothetical protein